MPKPNEQPNPFDEFTAGLERVEQQSGTIERLEAWLVEAPERSLEQINRPVVDSPVGFRVVLEDMRTGCVVTACEHGNPSKFVAIAKQPGLLATIEAALDKWEKNDV